MNRPKTDKDYLRLLVKGARKLRKDILAGNTEEYCESTGICSNIIWGSGLDDEDERDYLGEMLKQLFPSWHYYSGEIDFPVGGSLMYESTDNFYDGRWKDLRVDLLKHVERSAIWLI